ncbi:hypothetical protein [Nakamurella deserti]|uniref:hypothetical protein n=1 Tax=Nakamurella deserti TaxID=2164074 RepID=UPI000DBE5E01|nr:hypothetical protein [Nakamurella deserti]
MSAWHGGLFFNAVDYEIISVGSDRAAVGPQNFTDFWVTGHPRWRLVCGYLAVAVDLDAPDLIVTSHGYPAARLRLGDAGPAGLRRLTVAAHEDAEPAAAVLAGADGNVWSVGGVGFLVEDTPAGVETADGVEVGCTPGWRLTLVHGPSAAKIGHRLALLEALRSVGGRRG